MVSYNIFGRPESDVYCAVREDHPVPSFLLDRAWQFRGKVEDGDAGALPRSATVAFRFNGFYIFHPFESPKLAA